VSLFRSNHYASVAALVLANLAPLAGVFFAGWDAGSVVLLYWLENLIVGFYNVLKLTKVKTDDSLRRDLGMSPIPFFCVHYGFFCFGHGIFVLLLVSMSKGNPDLARLQLLFGQIVWPFLGLVVSHGVSYVANTLIGQEYKTITAKQQVWQPYRRIALLHVGILLAMFGFVAFGTSVGLLVSLVVVKTGADVYLYLRAHRWPATTPESA